jgi:hypothetical protein
MTTADHHAFEIAATPTAASEARSVLKQRFSAATGTFAPFEFELALSELVANAVEHGVGPVSITFDFDGHLLRIAVTSGAARSEPHLLHPDPRELHGRGLEIVAALATAWGHETVDGWVTVWAVLGVPDRRTGDQAR